MAREKAEVGLELYGLEDVPQPRGAMLSTSSYHKEGIQEMIRNSIFVLCGPSELNIQIMPCCLTTLKRR